MHAKGDKKVTFQAMLALIFFKLKSRLFWGYDKVRLVELCCDSRFSGCFLHFFSRDFFLETLLDTENFNF